MFGNRKLLVACDQGRKDEIERLLEPRKLWIFRLPAKAKVSARYDGATLLHFAAMKGDTEIAALILAKGGDANACDNGLLTPLHRATMSGHRDLAELLIDSGAVVDARDGSRHTPLHLASIFNQIEIAELLVSRGADVNAVDKLGATPLLRAISEGHVGFTELIVSKGANVNAADNEGITALQRAAMHENRGISEMLVANGAVDMIEVDARSCPCCRDGGEWQGGVWSKSERYMVPRIPDVPRFFADTELPLLLPQAKDYVERVQSREDPQEVLRSHWALAFMHHPDPMVVVETIRVCLRFEPMPSTIESTIKYCVSHHQDQVASEAAKAIWSEQMPLGGVFSRMGHLSRPQRERAIQILRAHCPEDRISSLLEMVPEDSALKRSTTPTPSETRRMPEGDSRGASSESDDVAAYPEIPPDPKMDELESKMNATANFLAYESRGWIEWLMDGDRITGLWVRAFPGNTRQQHFLGMFCAKEDESDAYVKVRLGAYTVERAARGTGYDVLFS